jgi:signal transduction histidine kinase
MSDLNKVLAEKKIDLHAEGLFDILEHEVYIVNEEREILWANKKKLDIYGNDIIGKKCHEIFPFKKRLNACPDCPCTDIFEEGRENSLIEHFEARGKGDKRYINETAVKIEGRDSKKFALVIGREITKRHKLDLIKSRLVESMSSQMRYVKQVTSIVDQLGALYKRVRFYDVVTCSRDDDKLFVMRGSAGMKSMHESGYNFRLKDEGYKPITDEMETPRIWDGKEVKLTNPNNKCLIDLGLEDELWIHLPLLFGEKLIGLICLDNKGGAPVTKEDFEHLKLFADFTAIAISTIRNEMNIHILGQINEAIARSLGGGELHKMVAREICCLVEAAMCSIFIYVPKEGKLKLHANHVKFGDLNKDYDPFGENYSPGEYLTGYVYEQGTTFNICDFGTFGKKMELGGVTVPIQTDYIKKYEELISKEAHRNFKIKNAIFAPLWFENNKLGVIRVVNNRGEGLYPFPDTDLDLLELTASQVSAHTFYENMKFEVDDAITQIIGTVSGREFKIEEVADNITQVIMRMSGAKAATFLMVDDDGKKLKSKSKLGYKKDAPEVLEYNLDVDTKGTGWEKGIGLSAWVALTGNEFTADEWRTINEHPAHKGEYQEFVYEEGERAESLLALPMKAGGNVIGVLKVEDSEKEKFPKSFKSMFELMTNLAGLALSSALELERRRDTLISMQHELGIPADLLQSMGDVMDRRYNEDEEPLDPQDEMLYVRKRKLRDFIEDLKAASIGLKFHISMMSEIQGSYQYHFNHEYLRPIIRETIWLLRIKAKGNCIEIDLVGHSPSKLYCDKDKLKQAFYNIILNGVKYSYDDGRVEVELRDKGDKIEINIRDWGIGIPEDEKNDIFKKDFRGAEAKKKAPTGFGRGLHISEKIIRDHGGTVTVSSLKDPTVFTITLPARIRRLS